MEENLSNKKDTVDLFEKKEKKKKSQKTNNEINFIFNMVAIICLIIMAVAITPKTMQNDTYYNIKCGEYLVQNGILGQTEDPFSWHDLAYTWPHWLFDICIYLVYAVCGVNWEIRDLCFYYDINFNTGAFDV